MGQILMRQAADSSGKVEKDAVVPMTFPNLSALPPELALAILSHLDATDLCLASCVWQHLGNDEILWHSLCKNSWGHASIYRRASLDPTFSYRKLYMQLDEATLTFNGDPFAGEEYLFTHGLVDDTPTELAKFIHMARKIKSEPRRLYLDRRRGVLRYVMELQKFENLFLPNALRKLFREISAPKERGNYLEQILDAFSEQFCRCNPQLGLHKDIVYLLCFSLILLSVDLTSPHIKNKMSKREFIKNTRRATVAVDEDLVGHLYDNIYLIGHVAGPVSVR